jgi:hypothetical protein
LAIFSSSKKPLPFLTDICLSFFFSPRDSGRRSSNTNLKSTLLNNL